jgi:hypothetical protein
LRQDTAKYSGFSLSFLGLLKKFRISGISLAPYKGRQSQPSRWEANASVQQSSLLAISNIHISSRAAKKKNFHIGFFLLPEPETGA